MKRTENKVLKELKDRDEKLKKMGLYAPHESDRPPLDNPGKQLRKNDVPKKI